MSLSSALSRHINSIHASVDAGLERFASNAVADARRSFNVEQDDTRWTLSLNVPGLSRQDLSIGIEDAVVRIESNAKLENGVLTPKLGKHVLVSNVAQLTIN